MKNKIGNLIILILKYTLLFTIFQLFHFIIGKNQNPLFYLLMLAFITLMLMTFLFLYKIHKQKYQKQQVF